MHTGRKITLILIGIIFFFLQVSFWRYLGASDVLPAFTLVMVIFTCLNTDIGFSLKYALSFGLLTDVASAGPLGLNGFLFSLAALAGIYFSNKIYKGNILLEAGICFLLSVLVAAAYFFLAALFVPASGFLRLFRVVILPEAVLTALLYAVIWPLLKYSISYENK